jgi:hypothetical protein
MKETLKPLIDQIRVKLGNTDELRDSVKKNLSQTRDTIEATAKEVVRQTKNSKIMTDYVRPAVESPKAEEALSKLETKITQSGPLVSKLREIRKQFLDATKPAVTAKTPKRKKTAKPDDQTKVQ